MRNRRKHMRWATRSGSAVLMVLFLLAGALFAHPVRALAAERNLVLRRDGLYENGTKTKDVNQDTELEIDAGETDTVTITVAEDVTIARLVTGGKSATLTGPGKLTINCGENVGGFAWHAGSSVTLSDGNLEIVSSNQSPGAIGVHDGVFTVRGNSSLTITARNSGIFLQRGHLMIENGNVTVNCTGYVGGDEGYENSGGSGVFGITPGGGEEFDNHVTVNGGNVSVTGVKYGINLQNNSGRINIGSNANMTVKATDPNGIAMLVGDPNNPAAGAITVGGQVQSNPYVQQLDRKAETGGNENQNQNQNQNNNQGTAPDYSVNNRGFNKGFPNLSNPAIDDSVVPWTYTGWWEFGGKKYWYEDGIRQGTLHDPDGVWIDGTNRGREIYDPGSDGWYWLDALYDGMKAESKEVYIPYVYQDEEAHVKENDNAWIDGIARFSNLPRWDGNINGMFGVETVDLSELIAGVIRKHGADGGGKWVRYDGDGKMVKGWYRVEGKDAELYESQAGNTYYYDRQTGLMVKGTVTIDGVEYRFDEISGVLQP